MCFSGILWLLLVLEGVHRREVLGHSNLGQFKPLLLQNRDLCVRFTKVSEERISNLHNSDLFSEMSK